MFLNEHSFKKAPRSFFDVLTTKEYLFNLLRLILNSKYFIINFKLIIWIQKTHQKVFHSKIC